MTSDRDGTPGQNLSRLVGQARGLADKLNLDRDESRHVRHELVTFTAGARTHLAWEQHSRGGRMTSPEWWRAYYLARVLADLESATLAPSINRVSVERLLQQWLSEQKADREE